MPCIPDLDRLLSAGARYSDSRAEYVIEPHPVGQAILPTGRVIGCDPLSYAADAPPFTVTVPAGTYPLRAWVAVLYQDGAESDRRVAALQLAVRDEPAMRWEFALTDGRYPHPAGNAYDGYPVDAGVGTMADLVAVRGLAGWDYDRLEQVYIAARIPETPVPGAIGAVTDEQSGANVIVVESGWGDGVYPTFIGYTAANAVSSLVTDFRAVP
jgi:hypothetical protein